jgi:hypothetical protein
MCLYISSLIRPWVDEGRLSCRYGLALCLDRDEKCQHCAYQTRRIFSDTAALLLSK